jgi:hypothetical protein
MPDLPNWVSWLGWFLTAVGTAIGGWQVVKERERRLAHHIHSDHLRATLDQLALVRASFSEALNGGEALKSDADRVLVRGAAYSLLGAEGHLRKALGIEPDAK